MQINQINTNTKEGKLLMMALASLTVSPEINLGGKSMNGRTLTPDEALEEVEKVAKDVYKEGFEDESLKDIPASMAAIKSALSEDQSEGSYYHTWQANIAMCFYDECKAQGSEMERQALHQLCNDAAKRFLNHLTA